ncbi:Hpt domain-containing protein [Velocimicrobium porci]|uniref:Hpt domain-containing protein n=1 Tax=Velocimicrobium porci TaxID=2606634 RepID=A0A6L5XZV3_9FIRM|nr:Hpt domain-containing protein [Velocimicrobium porci]MSS64244.1 Hpt domain-containing protein [Velocimicrobium porci]
MEEVILEKLQNMGIDVESTLKRFMQREDLYIRFLHKFIQDQNFAGLKNSLEVREYEEAFKYAHTLKGVAGNLGLTPLYEEVNMLVEKLRCGDDIKTEKELEEKIWKNFEKVEENYNEIYQIITEE